MNEIDIFGRMNQIDDAAQLAFVFGEDSERSDASRNTAPGCGPSGMKDRVRKSTTESESISGTSTRRNMTIIFCITKSSSQTRSDSARNGN